MQGREAARPRAALVGPSHLLPDSFRQPGQVSAEDIPPEKPEKSLEGQGGKDTSQNTNTFNMEGARAVLGASHAQIFPVFSPAQGLGS